MIRDLHPWNTEFLTDVAWARIFFALSSVILESAKASASIEYDVFSSTPTFESPVQPRNALLPIMLKDFGNVILSTAVP